MNGNKVYLTSTEIMRYRNIMFLNICEIICRGENVTIDDLKVGTRWLEFIYPRQLIMFFVREFKLDSESGIGRFFHKSHATVIHACKVIQNYYDTDKIKRKEIDNYRTKIYEIKKNIELDNEFKIKYSQYETDKV